MIGMKILLIEDDTDLREIIAATLTAERYVVETAADYASACSKLFVYEYDCILLDIMLPGGSGLDLLRRLQAHSPKPCTIIISAKDAIEDRVAGLELGADDYLSKPFHLAELHARIKSVTRRHRRDGDRLIRLGNVTVDPDTFGVSVDDRTVELVRKEYDILVYLMYRPHRLVEKATLAEAVWGDYTDQADNFDFVYAQMKNLRKKLKDAHATVEIKTVYGFGYKLVET